jgi:uncharacterized protein (TIGR00661 family)
LVAPLDWGLGHATRCIPIIRALHKKNCEVIIASSGDALAVLKIEFPDLMFLELPSYRVRYSRVVPFMVSIFAQLPKFLWIIRREHVQTQRIVREQKIDMIISDSRFGCWSRSVPTVFISHQTHILMPPQWKWVEPLINFFNRVQIKKFTQCWIPDFPSHGVTGGLTNTHDLNVRFIGMISRFAPSETCTRVHYDYLLLISGPEPQRTVFEELLRKNISALPGKKMMVKGQPQHGQEIIRSEEFDEVGHLQADALQRVIESSDMIISRSGYTTVMDMAALRKKVFFIPTPGQTEQELLAVELEKRSIALYQDQNNVDVKKALQEMKNYTGFGNFDMPSDLLNEALDQLIADLNFPGKGVVKTT